MQTNTRRKIHKQCQSKSPHYYGSKRRIRFSNLITEKTNTVNVEKLRIKHLNNHKELMKRRWRTARKWSCDLGFEVVPREKLKRQGAVPAMRSRAGVSGWNLNIGRLFVSSIISDQNIKWCKKNHQLITNSTLSNVGEHFRLWRVWWRIYTLRQWHEASWKRWYFGLLLWQHESILDRSMSGFIYRHHSNWFIDCTKPAFLFLDLTNFLG